MGIDTAGEMAEIQTRIDYLEENRRFIQNCLETVLSLSDFHKHLGKDADHHLLLQEALEKFQQIIPFKGGAIYLVDEATSEFALTFCEPPSLRDEVAAQVEFMIEEGLFAWAIRERRGIFTTSRDHTRQFLVHVIANHARIQGMFVGLLPAGKTPVAETSLVLLSITLLNLANVMESQRMYHWVKNQNVILEKKVMERTLKLDRSRQELKAAMAELERMAHEADTANKAKSQFLANMSHEIRTPLNGIIGCAELMLKSDDPAHCRYLAGVSLSESEHLLNLINNVLDYSKIEAGRIELEQRPFDLEALLQAVISGLKIQAQAKELELELLISGNPQLTVVGDALRLRQVLVNLVNNAIKFTSQGKVSLALAPVPDGASGRQGLKFSVTDTGIGIPADRQDAIFKRFTQVDESTTRRYGGTGLGTAIAWQLVTLMGGELVLDSMPGRGTTFRFCITMPVAAAGTRTGAQRRGGGNDGCRDTMTAVKPAHILLAEDTPVNQMVIRSHLEAQGCTVVLADNGLLAVEACRTQRFDLVLMDIQMPEMDGIEAARRIGRQTPAQDSVPIIALTANADIHTREACEAAGMAAVLTKPIRRAPLLKAVRDILDASRRPAAARPHEAMTARADQPQTSDSRLDERPLDLETAIYEFGDRELVHRVIDQLIRNADDQIGEIRSALAENKIDIIKRISHAIKGGAATAEAIPLSEAAAKLEEQCKRGALDSIPTTVDRLEAAWQDLKCYVAAVDWQQENI